MARIMDKDINIRIISILFAFVLWLYVASEQNPIEYRNIKDISVKLINVESVQKSGLVINEGEDYKVDITLKGKRDMLSEIIVSDISIKADLRGFNQKGVNTVPVEVEGLPDNVELVDITPKHIKVTLEPIITVEVPVKVVTTGNTEAGYTALHPKVTPAQVLARGPEDQLSGIKVVTATLDLSGVEGNVTEVLPVKAMDRDNNEVTDIEISPDIVEVTVPVRKTRKVPVEVTLDGHPSTGKEISGVSQDINHVVIYGEENVLKNLDTVETKPVRIWGIEDGTYYDANLILPEGVWTVDGVNTVSVFVDIESLRMKQINIEKINFIGIPEGLEMIENQNAPTVMLTIEGKESIINALTAEDINVYSNLTELDKGKHTISLQVKLPEGVVLKGMEPQEIEIELVSMN